MPEPTPAAEMSEPNRNLNKLWTLTRLLYAGFSVASIVTGIAYLPITTAPSSLPAGLDIMTSVIPIWVWGGMWVVAGFAGVLAAVMDLRPPWLAIGTALQVGVTSVWAMLYTAGWLTEWDRAYVNAASYWRQCLPILGVAVLARMLRPVIRADR